jgi:hypothetical protein
MARCFALNYAISLVGEYVAAAHFDPLNPLAGFLFTFGLRSLLSLVLLYFLFRRGKKSLPFALGLGAATAFIALFGVASNALFSPLGRSFNLSLALIIFSPITPPFVDMMHQPNPQLATEGLWLLWSFGICSAVFGISSVVTFRKMADEANGMGGLRFAFRAGICCPLVVWADIHAAYLYLARRWRGHTYLNIPCSADCGLPDEKPSEADLNFRHPRPDRPTCLILGGSENVACILRHCTPICASASVSRDLPNELKLGAEDDEMIATQGKSLGAVGFERGIVQ